MINIVLIDSDCLFQKAFTKMIAEQKKCRLAGIAETKEEAIQIVENCYPQLIFIDIILEEKENMDICSELRERCPEAAIYILSSYRNLRLMQKAMEGGVEKYFSKPVSRIELYRLLDSYNDEETLESTQYIEGLLLNVKNRDYLCALEENKKIIQKIMKEQVIRERKEKLMYLISFIISTIPEMAEKKKKIYIQKHKLNSLILKDETLCCNWLNELITEVFRYLCITRYTYMGKVLQFIEENKSSDITLTQLSEESGISSGHLSRVFKKCYNISIVDYVHLRKLHTAKYYMASSEMNISDISFLLGYNEAGYFCKIFKRYEGMTPTTFYQNIKKR